MDTNSAGLSRLPATFHSSHTSVWRSIAWGVALMLGVGTPHASHAVSGINIAEINPDQSTFDPIDPDAASGGRVNGLATVAGNNDVFYAASEWGGLYKSEDRGRTWLRLNRHLPVATWDVEVNPKQPQRVYATSFYDGRVTSLAGINVSTDGGNSWTHPVTAMPPAGFCSAARRTEPSAFGISVDLDNSQIVYIGTNCGLAISNDAGSTWRFVDPTPNDPATNVWDVVIHHGGIIDLCGDDGHFRSTNGGTSWTTGTGLPSGRCSIAASPGEATVLFAAAAQNVYESDNGGANWTNLGTPDSRRQGRVEFVATNLRSNKTFDLWYGDVHLFRGACQSSPTGGGLRCPMARTGTPMSPPPPGWSGPFTRSAGGHDDVGDIAFDSEVTENACPVIFSSDGGIYFNTKSDHPGCQSPAWEQPRITPHSLWAYAMDGADQPGPVNEDLYFGNQDNGPFAATNAGAASPSWNNISCCDAFDITANLVRVVFTICCGFSILVANPGMTSPVPLATNPPGTIPTFNFPDFINRFGTNQHVAVTSSGAFITNNITANPVVWTQLGASSTPPGGFCAVKTAVSAATPTFYAQTQCLGGQVWKYVGTAPGGTWQRIDTGLTGGIGVFAVNPTDPNRLYASNLNPAGPRMVFSTDGGSTWNNDSELDNLMTGSGAFLYRTRRGPTQFTGFGGYVQPSLVGFDREDTDIVIAGGQDSGVFISDDRGANWTRVTDPIDSGNSGIPHIPRPWFAYFDHEAGSPGAVNVYVGTQGRGVWRIGFQKFQPKFEYAAKVVCGIQKDPDSLRLAKGLYATAVNVHNPNDGPVEIDKKIALTFPPKEEKPGEIRSIARDLLQSDEALEVDCDDLKEEVFPNGFPDAYIKGFVVIRSTESLDVTAVYTTADLDITGAPPPRIRHTSIDVEEISERQLGPRELPDLVPLDKMPPEQLSPFCVVKQPPTDPPTLVVTIKNQGPVSAGPSTAEVAFLRGDGTSLLTSSQPTKALLPGEETTVDFAEPQGWITGEGEFHFKITADSALAILELNEANNVGNGTCKVIG